MALLKVFNSRSLLTLILLAGLSACGGGGGSGGGTATGVFLDSAVQGMTYVSGSIAGLTDANGTFQYEVGKPVTFKIGDIVIGQAAGSAVITPVTLVPGSNASNPTVLNIVSFLLTLDDDANPNNGIQITSTVQNLATGLSINFAQSTTAFAADGNVQTVTSSLTSSTSAGARTLVNSTTAQNHISSTIWTIYAGNYTGTFSGSDAGTFDVTITTSGAIVGTGLSNTLGGFSIQGQISTSGTLSFAAGGTSSGATFSGSLVNGVLSGTWLNGAQSGTYTGNLASGNPTTGGGTGGVYGSLAMTGSSAVPGTFAPDASTGSGQGASQGFLQTVWSTTGSSFWTLSASIADNYQGVYGAEVTFGQFGVDYSCQSGVLGTYGDCSGASFDHTTRTVTFTNVQLQAPGFGAVITLNGTLNY